MIMIEITSCRIAVLFLLSTSVKHDKEHNFHTSKNDKTHGDA